MFRNSIHKNLGGLISPITKVIAKTMGTQKKFTPHKPREEINIRHKQHQTRPEKTRGERCGYCGLTGVHKPGKDCPAYGKKCRYCGRWNHFTKVCTDKHPRENRQRKGRQIKKTSEEAEKQETSSDEEFFQQTVKHLAHIQKIKKIGESEKTIPIRLDDVITRIEPDTGADVNLMDEHQFKAFKNRCQEERELEPSNIRLHTIQGELTVKGKFKTIARNQTRGIPTEFIVIRGRIQSPPLVGKKTLTDLGMLQICEDGRLEEPNELRIGEREPKIKALTKDPEEARAIQEILQGNPEAFQGIGCIRDKKRDQEIYGRFNMRPDVEPVTQKPRNVPYYLQKPLKLWLEQGLEADIFEKVPEGEPVTWCSPLVVQPKPRYTNTAGEQLQPHMIRASVDLRIPNKYMERNRVIQNPVVEDFIHKFHDCKIWSKLDLRQGYHQLQLHPESRSVGTFCTPWGNYRPKRLIFGAKAAQDLFDEKMYQVFGDIPGCLNQRDDILIGGRNWMEHNRTLSDVLQRAKDFGITFNKEKCQFGREEIEFYGYLFTKEGLKPTLEKTRAVENCQPPKTKSAVKSFLGMTGYLSKFIPRYSSLTAPLRELTENKTEFEWSERHQQAYDTLKEEIVGSKTMAFFDPTKTIVVRTEASYHEGLSAGLFQKTERGLQPVHFISRTMTPTEKRYSQTEKDALAVKWAKERLKIYLLGAPKFKIITAHKPLVSLFNKPTAKLPPRIERMVMAMQDVDYELIYEPGKDERDPLDFLSRHPLPETGRDETEKVIKYIIQEGHAVILDHIREETQKDQTLQKLNQRILHGDWLRYKGDREIEPFYAIRHELYTADGTIFRLNRIVMPEALQRKVINNAHKMGHFGKTRTKQML